MTAQQEPKVSEPTVSKLSDIGPRGLVVFNGTKFQYVKEDTWRKYQIQNASDTLKEYAKNTVAAGLANNGTFVNLRLLAGLQKDPAFKGTPLKNGKEDGAVVVLCADDGLYSVSPDQLKDIPPGFEGDAGVLVSRGAVVATIPQNVIQTGSWCVLVNTSSVAR